MEWTPIDVSEAHQDALGTYDVIAALEGFIPWIEEQATVYYQSERKLDMLEQFVVRCLVELEPIQSPAEISDILGLGNDKFVQPIVAELTRMNLISSTEDGFRPSDELRNANEKGVWVDQYDRALWSVCNPFTGRRLPKRPGYFEQRDIDTGELPSDKTGLPSLKAWATGDSGPLQGTTITRAEMDHRQLLWEPFELLIFEDHHENTWGWEPYNPRKQQITRAYRGACNALGATERAHDLLSALDTGEPVASGQEIEERPSVSQAIREGRNLAQQEYIRRYGTTEAAIRINEAIQQAEHEVLISFPWIKGPALTRELMDALSSALDRGAYLYIGYGISESPHEEDSHEDAIQRLRGLDASSEGHSCVVWTGESHVKEIVIDRNVYLGGSFNRLSFRGDPNRRTGNVRRESMIHTNAEAVAESSIREFVPILRDALAAQITHSADASSSLQTVDSSEDQSANGQLALPKSYAQWRRRWRSLFRLGARPQDIQAAFAQLPNTGRKWVNAADEILSGYQDGGDVPPEAVFRAVDAALQNEEIALTDAARSKLHDRLRQFVSNWNLEVDTEEIVEKD